jgi:hypothetical protein
MARATKSRSYSFLDIRVLDPVDEALCAVLESKQLPHAKLDVLDAGSRRWSAGGTGARQGPRDFETVEEELRYPASLQQGGYQPIDLVNAACLQPLRRQAPDLGLHGCHVAGAYAEQELGVDRHRYLAPRSRAELRGSLPRPIFALHCGTLGSKGCALDVGLRHVTNMPLCHQLGRFRRCSGPDILNQVQHATALRLGVPKEQI